MATELDPTVARRSVLSSDNWWEAYRHKLAGGYLELIAAEANASKIRYLNPIVVPGLLQTRDYATGVTSATMLHPTTSEEAELYVDIRMRRQADVFERSRVATLVFLIEEIAIRRRVGSGSVMREQIDHLIDVLDHPAVTLVVLPSDLPPHPGLAGSFTLIQHADPRIDDLLFFEGPMGNVIVRDRPDMCVAYGKLSDRLAWMGLSGRAAAGLLRSIRDEVSH
jgi:hypothetical protein